MVQTLDELLSRLSVGPLSQDLVNNILRETKITRENLSRYVIFNKACYTRNLIHRNDYFELMVICWDAGHQTPLHDHNQSSGWMLPIEGNIHETRYQMKQDPKPHFEKVSTHPVAGAAYIDDFIGMHVLHNDSGKQAITLHLYSPPIRECRYYDAQSAASRVATMRYYSIDGELCK